MSWGFGVRSVYLWVMQRDSRTVTGVFEFIRSDSPYPVPTGYGQLFLTMFRLLLLFFFTEHQQLAHASGSKVILESMTLLAFFW